MVKKALAWVLAIALLPSVNTAPAFAGMFSVVRTPSHFADSALYLEQAFAIRARWAGLLRRLYPHGDPALDRYAAGQLIAAIKWGSKAARQADGASKAFHIAKDERAWREERLADAESDDAIVRENDELLFIDSRLRDAESRMDRALRELAPNKDKPDFEWVLDALLQAVAMRNFPRTWESFRGSDVNRESKNRLVNDFTAGGSGQVFDLIEQKFIPFDPLLHTPVLHQFHDLIVEKFWSFLHRTDGRLGRLSTEKRRQFLNSHVRDVLIRQLKERAERFHQRWNTIQRHLSNGTNGRPPNPPRGSRSFLGAA